MSDSQVPDAQGGTDDERLKRIEDQLDSIKGTVLPDPVTTESAETFQKLEDRARSAKQTLKKHTAEGQAGAFVGAEGGKNLGKGLRLAYAIIGLPLVGFGIGWLIDRQIGGTTWQGLMTVAGAAFAIFYAVRSANT